MPIDVLVKKSNISEIKIDTSPFVHKQYLRSNYIENDIEENIYMKNQLKIKNLKDPISIRDTSSKKKVDEKFTNPSIIETQVMLISMINI